MVYSCVYIETTGPNGSILRPKAAEDTELSFVGTQDGRDFYIGTAAVEQHPEIDLRQEPPTTVETLLKTSPKAKALKQYLRKEVEAEVGDIYDLLADQGKMLEMVYAMLARLSLAYLSGTPMPAEVETQYLQRAQAVVDAIDSDAVTLRGSFEDMDKVLDTLMTRQSKLNALVRDVYKARLEIDLE